MTRARAPSLAIAAAAAAVVVGIAAGIAACGSSHDAPPATSTTTLVLRVTDDAGQPLPARVLLRDATGAQLHIGTIDLFGARQGATACAFAPDAIGTWDGLIVGEHVAEIPIGVDHCKPSPAIPYGRYTVWAWHGDDFDRWEGQVDLSAAGGRVELTIPLHRAWTARGALAADMHVHSHDSDDSNMPDTQRVLAQVAAGIQVIGFTNHNHNSSAAAAIHALGLEHLAAAIPSNELTSEQMHLGVYPVTVDPASPTGGGPPPQTIVDATPEARFAIAHAFPGEPIVQLNHPRFRVYALYDVRHWNGVAWPPPFPRAFDAVEVLNGFTAFNVAGDRRIDDSVRDFYTLTDHGWLVAPVGNSDTHDFNWVHDGLARTLVFSAAPTVSPFDQAAFVAAVRARRTEATTGPWLDVSVRARDGAPTAVGPGERVTADGGAVWVDVTIAQANFMRVDQARIVVGTPTGLRVVRDHPDRRRRRDDDRGTAASRSAPPTRGSVSMPAATRSCRSS